MEDRIDRLEKQFGPDGSEDVVITVCSEDHERSEDGVMIPIFREPIGYTEVEWRDCSDGSRMGVRYALYGDEEPKPGEVVEWPKEKDGND